MFITALATAVWMTQLILIAVIIKSYYMDDQASMVRFGNRCHKLFTVLFIASLPVFSVHYILNGVTWGLLAIVMYVVVVGTHLHKVSTVQRGEALSLKSTPTFLSWALFPLLVGGAVMSAGIFS